MSDETTPSPEISPKPAAESIPPRARRISTPRPKKVAKGKEVVAAQVVLPPAEPELQIIEESPASSPETEWPEPDAASSGQPSQTESAKRKRRRRKGKGKGDGSQNGPALSAENAGAAHEDGADEPAASEGNQAPRPANAPAAQQKPHSQQAPQHQAPRPKIDPELLTKMAWKIYLAEVSEEGVALIGDNDAKDLSRRCFRLAEIFVEEQLRRR